MASRASFTLWVIKNQDGPSHQLFLAGDLSHEATEALVIWLGFPWLGEATSPLSWPVEKTKLTQIRSRMRFLPAGQPIPGNGCSWKPTLKVAPELMGSEPFLALQNEGGLSLTLTQADARLAPAASAKSTLPWSSTSKAKSPASTTAAVEATLPTSSTITHSGSPSSTQSHLAPKPTSVAVSAEGASEPPAPPSQQAEQAWRSRVTTLETRLLGAEQALVRMQAEVEARLGHLQRLEALESKFLHLVGMDLAVKSLQSQFAEQAEQKATADKALKLLQKQQLDQSRQVAAVDHALNALQSQQAKFGNQVAAFDPALRSLQAQQDAQSHQTAAADQALKSLRKQQGDLGGQMVVIEQAFKAQHAEQKRQVAALGQALKSMETEQGEKFAAVEKVLRLQQAEQKGHVAAMEQTLKSLESEHESKLAAIEDSLTALQSQQVDQSSLMAAADKDLKSIQKQHNDLGGKFVAIELEFRTRCLEYKEQLASIDQTLKVLETEKVAKLAAEEKVLKSQMADIEQALKSLEAEQNGKVAAVNQSLKRLQEEQVEVLAPELNLLKSEQTKNHQVLSHRLHQLEVEVRAREVARSTLAASPRVSAPVPVDLQATSSTMAASLLFKSELPEFKDWLSHWDSFRSEWTDVPDDFKMLPCARSISLALDNVSKIESQFKRGGADEVQRFSSVRVAWRMFDAQLLNLMSDFLEELATKQPTAFASLPLPSGLQDIVNSVGIQVIHPEVGADADISLVQPVGMVSGSGLPRGKVAQVESPRILSKDNRVLSKARVLVAD